MNIQANALEGTWSSFADLSGQHVYDLLRLRQDIFVVEQECPYSDIDCKDQIALHYRLTDRKHEDLAGALRLFLPGAGPDGLCRIGRVVVAKTHRGRGLGREMMLAAIAKAGELAAGKPIHLSGQAYLERFYCDLGFETVSEVFLEDGLEHIDMVRPV